MNIKITASTTEFNNAMKKAQKEIDGLAEAIDSLGSSKFGNKLEEQFDGLTKAIKKVEDQITDMLDSLDDLGKTKFGKVEDGLEDISKAGEKLNKTLEDTTDSIEDIDKLKFGKLEKQFKDIVDSGKDFNEKVEDIIDLLDRVDRQDLNGLEKEFDQVRDALERISKETRDSTDTMEKNFRDVTDEVDKFIRELNNVEDTKLENLEESIKDLDKYIDEAAESVDDFNKKTNDLDTKEIEDYIDSLKEVGVIGEDVQDALKKIFGAFDGKNGKFDFNLSDKGKDGLMSTLAEGLVSGTVAGSKLEKVMEGVADSIKDVADNMEKLDDAIDTKSIDELGEEYRKAENAMEKLTEEYDDLVKKQEECEEAVEKSNKAQQENLERQHELANALSKVKKEIAECEAEMNGYKKVVDDFNNGQDSVVDQINDVNKAIEDQEKKIEDAKKAYDSTKDSIKEIADQYNYLLKVYKDLKAMNPSKMDFDLTATKDGETSVIKNFKSFEEMEEHLSTLHKMYQDLSKVEAEYSEQLSKENDSLDNLNKRREALEEQLKVVHDQKEAADQAAKSYNDMADKLDELRKKAAGLEDALEDAINEGTFKDLQKQADKFDLSHIKKQGQEAAEELEKIKERMAEINKVGQNHADDFDKQYKAYEKLSKKVKEYLENEENGILLREKVAKSFKQVADSMEAVYKDSSKLNNFELVNKTLKEAAEHIKDLNLVSTENLQADLNRLGEIIEDKTEKIKRFKELNKEFGSDASKAAYGLEKQAQDIRDWANSADFAIEAADKLTNAWGDLSAAGEDHLKIRERAKYIEDFGEALEKNVAQIRNNYKELETLDEIYEKCTDKERGILDDYKMWEKNKDALLEYNRAITEYLRTIKDSGGQIDTKFLDELGKFDPQKFIDGYEKMGASSVVLSKQINAVKLELLESIKAYKENAKAAVENAEAALEQAKNEKKIAESQEDRLKAVEKIKKAEEDLANAKEKLKNYDKEGLETLRDQIKEYNRLAEAMREIGMAAKDIEKADISKFDKSLASMLDRLDTFGNDIPKTFADLKEDISAVFSDMDSLDFGDALDGLKEIGAGVLSKIPAEAKLAAAAIAGITIALKECAEEGVQQFTRGMETLSGALSGIVGVARDIGQEVRDAFENITGMQLDMSSMMEIPVHFEAQMQRVKAIGELTEEEFKRMEDLAIKLGATTRYGATEVGEAMEYMGQAGWGADQIEKGVEAVLNLATVADMDLGKAAETVTDVINAFKNAGDNSLTAEDAGTVADMLNVAAVKTSTSIEQLKSAFTNVAPIAGSFKMDLKDLTAALALMGDQGVKGAKAGTAMKNLIANLNKPTEERLAWIKKYNLEGARASIVNGDLLGGIKQMKKALEGLDTPTKNAVIEAIAGKEALSGVSALLNSTEEDINSLEAAMENSTDSAKNMAEEFDKTLKGALLDLSGSLETTIIKAYQKIEEGTANVVNDITKFFNILNGFDTSNNGLTGIAGAMEHLEETTRGWGDAIANGLHTAINAIDDFVNGESFNNLLQAGTNIINGIADGIRRAADDGSLDSAISTAIRKIATWFSENLDTIIDVGKEIIDAISKGISENSDEIGEAIKAVMEMQTTIDKAIAKEKWKIIGQNLISFICEGIVSKVSVFVSAFTGFFEGCIGDIANAFSDLVTNKLSPMLFDPIATMGETIGNFLKEVLLSSLERAFDIDLSYFKDFNILNPTTWFSGGDKGSKKTSGKGSTSGKSPSIDTSKSPIDIINSNLSSGKSKTDATAASIGEGISSNITSKLETMDAQALKALNVEMQDLQKTVTSLGAGMATAFTAIQDSARTSFMGLTNIVRNQLVNVTNIMRNQMVNSANIVRNQCVNMTNIFRNQFINMANIVRNQMLNVSNIIRNQAVNWSNIIRNQVTNARNAFTQQFMSMAAVARTQMVNVSNIIRNQAVSWKNVISNQAKNARDNLTRQFMSMAAVVRTQMSKCLSSVQSYMSKIAATTNKAMNLNVNVNRRVSTSYAAAAGGTSALSADALYAANAASTFSLGGNTGALAYGASSAMPAGGGNVSGGNTGGSMIIEIPLYVDGKEMARATAKYVDNELKQITKRENRKRGAK